MQLFTYNLDTGVNKILAEKLGLLNVRILQPIKGNLQKLVTFCPVSHAENVRQTIFENGGGQIGNYDSCSFNMEGKGTFRASEGTIPFVGN